MSKCRGLTARARTGNWSIHYKTCYRGGTDGGALPIRKTRSRMPRTGLIPANSRTSHPNVSCSFLIRGRLFRLACWSDEYLATSTWLRWKYPSVAKGSTVSRRSPGVFLRATWLDLPGEYDLSSLRDISRHIFLRILIVQYVSPIIIFRINRALCNNSAAVD